MPIAADEVIDVRHGMFGVTGSGDTSGYGRLVREVALPGSIAAAVRRLLRRRRRHAGRGAAARRRRIRRRDREASWSSATS